MMENKDIDYRDINRISNSDLSRFRSEVILGKPYRFPIKAAQFGNELHKLVLEPPLFTRRGEGGFTAPLAGLNYALLQRLADKVQADPFCQHILPHAYREHVVLFEEAETKAACKCKLDMYRQSTIVDLKTTSERDYWRFYESTQRYDYDRQAAFYLDATGADTFVFIGVQKVKPYELFYYEITRDQGAVDYGRKKYKALLKSYLKHYHPCERLSDAHLYT